MRFSDFVVNEVEGCGAFLAFDWMGGPAVAPNYRYVDRAYWPVDEPTDCDDWTFSAGWDLLGYNATIIRGPERYCIELRGFEALKLLKIQDRLEREAKEKRWREKNAYKSKEVDAAWWP